MIRLRELRNSRHITLKDAAADMQMSTSTLSCYERGKRRPTPGMLARLADYFNVSVDYLLERTDDSGVSLGEPQEAHQADQPGEDPERAAQEDPERAAQEDPEMVFAASLSDGMSYADLSPEGKAELYKFYQWVKARYPKQD